MDLTRLARQIDVDPIIHQALSSCWGVRILRQDPWECLASFILSSFNNIPRLKGMLERLSAVFGEPAGVSHRFPRPEVLAAASERVLRHCGLGYRAPYIKEAARRVALRRAPLDRWGSLEDEPLRQALLTLPGVGEKVVECVLLFAFGREGAFPVDVWIGRAMRRWYFRGRRVTDREVRAFARRHFGPRCGWAQQYLYHWAREARGSPLKPPYRWN